MSLALLLSTVSGRASAQAMPGMTHAATVPSASLSFSLDGKTTVLQPADLSAMARETVTVMNDHLKKQQTYTGVPLSALLAKMGLPFEKANEHRLLKSYLVAKGTDGYVVVVSIYETLSTVHQGSAIVADTVDGQPLGPDGAFKLILSSDKRPQRWVRNLASISLETVP